MKIENEIAKQFYKTQLHDGEVEVMILAKECEADLVVIDDNNAKKHAKYLGLQVTGTLGVLIIAKKQGYLPLVKPVLEQMGKNHLYISERVVKMCLELAGEM